MTVCAAQSKQMTIKVWVMRQSLYEQRDHWDAFLFPVVNRVRGWGRGRMSFRKIAEFHYFFSFFSTKVHMFYEANLTQCYFHGLQLGIGGWWGASQQDPITVCAAQNWTITNHRSYPAQTCEPVFFKLASAVSLFLSFMCFLSVTYHRTVSDVFVFSFKGVIQHFWYIFFYLLILISRREDSCCADYWRTGAGCFQSSHSL